MLLCLKYLVRPPVVFDFLRREADFYSKLIVFCRDGASMNFNKNAWSLFYQILYQQQGVLDFLVKGNVLPPFLDLIGTSYNNVVISNALHYTTKLFLICVKEQRLQSEGRPPSRNTGEKDTGLKSLEKDCSTLNKFWIDRRLFIKIHMIFKKLIPTYAGTAFLELAHFYYQLASSAGFHKLYKDTVKKTEYKEGIVRMVSMFNPEGFEAALKMSSPSNIRPQSIGKGGGFGTARFFKDKFL